MIDVLFYIAVFAGAGLMVFNIIRYFLFVRRLRSLEEWQKKSFVLFVPGIFLILFLVGYVFVGIFGDRDLIVAGILLGGSIFVFLLLSIIYLIVRRLQNSKTHLEHHFAGMEKQIAELPQGAIAAFRVNLTKDLILSVEGSGLCEKDVPGNSFSEALLCRRNTLLSQVQKSNTDSFRSDDLLRAYAAGHESAEEIVLTRRDNKSALFARLSATMLADPSTGDILAYIVEEDYSQHVILDTVLAKALSFRYDIVCSIVDGRYQLIASGNQEAAKAILPSDEFGEYADFLIEHVAPRLAKYEDQDAILRCFALDTISENIQGKDSYEKDLQLEWQGETYYKHFTFYAVTSDVPFFVLLVQDTTNLHRERALQNDRLSIALAEARSANAAKTIFFANMSHDIRTPMNAIIGFTQLALREDDPLKIKEFLTKIDSSSYHLLALINDVLEISHIESGKMELEFAPLEFEKALLEARDLFTVQMEQKGIRYELHVEPLAHPVVLTDRKKVSRVLMNLLSNAYKFTPSGGEVTIFAHEEAMKQANFSLYVIRVRDTGIGMSEEFLKHVFQAYERERKSTVDEIQGTGLGMTITKSIVDILGGDISVASELGKGTEFTVSLPMEFVTEQGQEQPVIAEPEDTYSAEEWDFSGLRILVVDDNEINCEIARFILEDKGIEVDTAENGKEAYDTLISHEEGYYSAVLLDVQMPVMDGLTAAREIRKYGKNGLDTIPIVAFTANAFHEDIQAAHDAGMDAHIAKPIDTEKLFAVLADLGLGTKKKGA